MRTNQEFLTLLDGVSAETTGNSLSPNSLHRVFQVIISNTATCVLEASVDNSNWITLRTSTASEGFSTSEPWPFIRGRVSSHTSGTVTLKMAG